MAPQRPTVSPTVPPHFTTGTPGVIALATELSRRLAETPCRVFTTPDSVVIESAPDSLPHGHWFTITLTETPTGFKHRDRQWTGRRGHYSEAVPLTSVQWSTRRSWSIGASWELERVNGKWVKRRTEKPFDLDHEIQQSLRAIGAT